MAVKNNLKLIFSYLKLNIKKEFQYKTSFFIQIMMMILNDAFFIIQWIVIFQIVDNIAGFGFNETMLLWSICAGGYGIAHTFFEGAFKLKHLIYDGRLDVFLTQPKNPLINISCSATDVSAIGDILYSFIVLFIIGAPWWWFLLIIPIEIFAGLLLVAVHITYSTLAFYIKKGDSIASSVDSALIMTGNYPSGIFNTVAKGILFTAIPTLFFAFIPAQFIFLTFNIWWTLGFFGAVFLWIFFAFVMFNLGLKKYNSGSLMGGRL